MNEADFDVRELAVGSLDRPVPGEFGERSVGRMPAAVTGAACGAVSAFAFAVLHDLLISDIWFALGPMLIAGAVSGLSIGWSYRLLFPSYSVGSWWRYNLALVAVLIALGMASLLVFEPRTTMAALVAANEPPQELIGAALPMTIAFTLIAAGVIAALFGGRWRYFPAVLLTCSVLVGLLGLNVSVIGLVEIRRGSFHLVAEMFGLVFFLAVVFAATFSSVHGRLALRLTAAER